MRMAVIGAGSWGTTMASLVAERSDVALWARRPDLAEAINGGENPDYLPGVALPPMRATSDLAEALDGAEAVLLAVPSHGLRSVLEAAPPIPVDIPILSLTKGIEQGSGMRMTEVIRDVLPEHRTAAIGVLSGPNLAKEIVAGEPAATVVALRDLAVAEVLQRAIMTRRFRVYTNNDVIGAEICGALKNVMAIAAGMITGMQFGLNTSAMFVTRALAEMARLGMRLGSNPLTFGGLAGLGDLVATSMSPLSRNHSVGARLGAGETIEEILATSAQVAEGVKTTPPVLALAEREGVEMPIAEEVGRVLRGESTPLESVERLMTREAQSEGHGIIEP
jgi:glycerol-3-phosphate dehydrogenase (NAD(P)+)